MLGEEIRYDKHSLALFDWTVEEDIKRLERFCDQRSHTLLSKDSSPLSGRHKPVDYSDITSNGSLQSDARRVSIKLASTCRYHQINPFDWLKDVLERMHLSTTSNMAELLPQNWKKRRSKERKNREYEGKKSSAKREEKQTTQETATEKSNKKSEEQNEER